MTAGERAGMWFLGVVLFMVGAAAQWGFAGVFIALGVSFSMLATRK